MIKKSPGFRELLSDKAFVKMFNKPLTIKIFRQYIMDQKKQKSNNTQEWDKEVKKQKEVEKQYEEDNVCPICKGTDVTNDGFACYFCHSEEFRRQTS